MVAVTGHQTLVLRCWLRVDFASRIGGGEECLAEQRITGLGDIRFDFRDSRLAELGYQTGVGANGGQRGEPVWIRRVGRR